MQNLGIFGFAAAVIAIVGLWNFLLRTFTERHRDWAWAQALNKFY
jgi:hypothetical protein